MGRGTGYLFMAVLAAATAVVRGQGWLRSEQEMRWLYEEWVVEHDKSHRGTAEKEKRFEIFKENLLFIDEHNRPDRNNTSTLGLNEFVDLTDDEFIALYLSAPINVSAVPSPPVNSRHALRVGQKLPDSVDWRDMGAVSPVKKQGKCGSCRAFTVVAAIEGLNKIVNGDMVTLSPQEIVDCDGPVNDGCNGGNLRRSYQYIVNNGGIDTEEHYPYVEAKGACRPDRVQAVNITDYKVIPFGDEYAMQTAVANHPVSAPVSAKSKQFRFHKSGVVRTGVCWHSYQINHGVAVIGYGREESEGGTGDVDYWLVKNSWGTTWGVAGIGKIERNACPPWGTCGIAMESVYPVMSGWVPPYPVVVDDDDAAAAAAAAAAASATSSSA